MTGEESAAAVKYGWWWKPSFKAVCSKNSYLSRWKERMLMLERAAWCYEAEARLIGQRRFECEFPSLLPDMVSECLVIWNSPPGMRQALDSLILERNAQTYAHPYDWMSQEQINSYNEVGFDRLTRNAEPSVFWADGGNSHRWRDVAFDLTVGNKTLKEALAKLLSKSPGKRRKTQSGSLVEISRPAELKSLRYLYLSVNCDYAPGAIFSSITQILARTRTENKISSPLHGLGPGANPRAGWLRNDVEAWKDIEAFDCWSDGKKVTPDKEQIVNGDFTESACADLHQRKDRMVWKYLRWTPSRRIPDELDEMLQILLVEI